MCDVTKLQEVYTNLLSNAIKYTPNGGTVALTINELPCRQDGYVCVQAIVQDNGIGMSREFLPHLFDSFTRERNTTLGKVAGTGLGMPIVKSLIELMGGTIEVESELGKGTKFTVTLTHKIAPSEYYEKPKDAVPSENTQDFTGMHLLLAEDNDLNAEIATLILQGMGFMVDRAEDGVVCVNKLEHSPAGTYDLILMDIQMPNMDGYKAARLIRRLPDKALANIPIVAMTANAFEEDRRRALENGMDAHIAKPIDAAVIRDTLGKILKPI